MRQRDVHKMADEAKFTAFVAIAPVPEPSLETSMKAMSLAVLTALQP
jgi:hypothetical protein